MIQKYHFVIKALEISQTIDLKGCLSGLGKHYPVIWTDPLMLSLSPKREQYLLVTSYGVIVLTNWSPSFEEKALSILKPFLNKPFSSFANSEEIKVVIDPNQKIRVLFDKIILPFIEEKCLLIISLLLSQSVGLESYEKRVDQLLDVLSQEIGRMSNRTFSFRTGSLIKNINEIMLLRQELVSNLGILDKPDLTWQDANLDFLYTHFRDSLELTERVKVLSEKFKLLQQNTTTALEIISAQRTQLLDLAIVALFILEIILFLLGNIK
jgi:uncharacterized Rmd1/YagE family protein